MSKVFKQNGSMTAGAALGGLVLIIPFTVAAVIWSGYVFSVLWSWFVSPVFGVPELSVAAAIGIVMITSYVAKPAPKEEPNSTKDAVLRFVVYALVKPAFALGIGFIVKQWM